MGKTSDLCHKLIPYRIISSTKFPVLLAKSNLDDNVEYIIKAFTNDTCSQQSFLREKYFLSSLQHPNIIKYVPKTSLKVDNITGDTKFIIMEYAPYGDFFSLVINNCFKDEKLIRTYFHQLINGIEYLHQQGIAHLDIKLENLLLGRDLLLKITDFDVSQSIDDEDLISQGSINYRAPEIIEETCTNYQAADIFSAGICLFTMISKIFPFVEESDENQVKFQNYAQFLSNKERYWRRIDSLLRGKSLISEDLRELLNGMWKKNPNERMTIQEIKHSKWYKGSTYSLKELQEVMLHNISVK